MKLLPKSEITRRQAADKKQAIDEGVKLATRIDVLRQTLADEERSLEKFRSETVAAINAEITALSARVSLLSGEVKELESRKEEALKPLTEQWELLEKSVSDVESRVHAVVEQEKQVQELYVQANDALEAAIKRETLSRYLEQEKRDMLDAALKDRKAAFLALEEARLQQIRTEREYKQKIHPLTIREERCAKREEQLTIKEKEIREEKSNLAKERKLLKDRQEMFERTINRTKS